MNQDKVETAPNVDDVQEARVLGVEYAVGRLHLEPGDVLVVKMGIHLSCEMANRMREYLTARIGDVPILIIEKGTNISVMSPSDIESSVANIRNVPQRIIELPVD